MELLVLGRCGREDGGHRQQNGGPVADAAVTHLVDHDGGHDDAQNLEENRGPVRTTDASSHLRSGTHKASINPRLEPLWFRQRDATVTSMTHRQGGQRQRHADADVVHQFHVVQYGGEAGLWSSNSHMTSSSHQQQRGATAACDWPLGTHLRVDGLRRHVVLEDRRQQ